MSTLCNNNNNNNDNDNTTTTIPPKAATTIRDIIRVLTIRKIIFHYISTISAIVRLKDSSSTNGDQDNASLPFPITTVPISDSLGKRQLEIAKGREFNHVQLLKALRFGRTDLFFKYFETIYQPDQSYDILFDAAVGTNNHSVMLYYIDFIKKQQQLQQQQKQTYNLDGDIQPQQQQQQQKYSSSTSVGNPFTFLSGAAVIPSGSYNQIQKRTIDILCENNIVILNQQFAYNCLKKLVYLVDVDALRVFLSINPHVHGLSIPSQFCHWNEACSSKHQRGLPVILEILEVMKEPDSKTQQVIWNGLLACALDNANLSLFYDLMQHVIDLELTTFTISPVVLSKTLKWKELVEYFFNVPQRFRWTYQYAAMNQLVQYKNVEGLKYFYQNQPSRIYTNGLLQSAISAGCMECMQFVLEMDPPSDLEDTSNFKWVVNDIRFGKGELLDIETINSLFSHPRVDFTFYHCFETAIKSERMDLFHRLSELAQQRLSESKATLDLDVDVPDKTYINIMSAYMIALQVSFWNRSEATRFILQNYPPPKVSIYESTSQTWRTSKFQNFDENIEYMHSHGLLNLSAVFNQTIINHSFYKGMVKPLQYFGIRRPNPQIANKVLHNALYRANYDLLVYILTDEPVSDEGQLINQNNLYQPDNNFQYVKEILQMGRLFSEHRTNDQAENTIKIAELLINQFECQITRTDIVNASLGYSHQVFGYVLEKSFMFNIGITNSDIFQYLKNLIFGNHQKDEQIQMFETLFDFVERNSKRYNHITLPVLHNEFIKSNNCATILLLLDRFKFNNHNYVKDPTVQKHLQLQLYTPITDTYLEGLLSTLHSFGSVYLIQEINIRLNKIGKEI
ncbi:hypothetical protein DFA_05855 [Cavenderia fasciculata]|uniref:Uncharacterized protein n=1 Tax=Cavenderia fasciculata TaxID=261658 RepID=F4PN31_CACFS|nr:uncharacterized protein DFA_05855 [Cavenderia fasciculata]EGG23721.1 hypothetical protein DFA_05855 [Cavenderia fasciculata]|eukprot:XP_004361572.1 hypothetical protein DFA_05855 [Cavenderia fasciculata]